VRVVVATCIVGAGCASYMSLAEDFILVGGIVLDSQQAGRTRPKYPIR
jgi:hypothetical protein